MVATSNDLVPMDAEAYENQFKPWLGPHRYRWADAHTRPGPPGIRLVPRRLAEAFVKRANQRAITDAEERALGLPGDEPDWDQREVYNRDPKPR
jgi:hypothetical protein